MRSKRGSKTEFSKKILITVTIATILIVIASFVLMWQTRDHHGYFCRAGIRDGVLLLESEE